MSKLDRILEQHKEWLRGIKIDRLIGVDSENTKQQIKELFLELIGEDNEHHRDMPVPDPDPFALPSDHQNQLRRYLRQKVSEL